MTELEKNTEYNIGRLEGKIDLILIGQNKQEECVKALHFRVDNVEEDVESIRAEQKIFKRDVKWVVAIGAAIIAAVKFIATQIIK